MQPLLKVPLAVILVLATACSSAAPVAAPSAASAAPSAASAAATAIAKPSPTPIPMKMNIANAVAYGSFMVARDNGFWKDAGITLESAGQVITGTDQMQAMLGGSFAFTATSTVGWYAALQQGVPITAVAVYAGGGDRIGLLARKGLTVKTGADLVGKTIGSPTRNISQESLYAYLASEGVDASKVKIVTVTDDAMPAALASGTVDAGVTVEPYVSAAVNGGQATLVTRLAKYIGNANNVIVFPTQYVKDNAEAVDRFLTGFVRGMQFMRQKPTEASVILGKQLTNLEPAMLKVSQDFLIWDPRFTAEAMKSFQNEMDLQLKLGWIAKPFDLKAIIDTKPLDNVMKNRPEYFTDLK